MSEYDEVVASLKLVALDDDSFLSRSPDFGWKRIYGGLLLSHALMAAQLTIDDRKRQIHSLHGYFLRPGNTSEDLRLTVERLLDGRTLSHRRVTITQRDKVMFAAQCSFRTKAEGLDYRPRMPDVPLPESLIDEAAMTDIYKKEATLETLRYFQRQKPFELRPVDHKSFMRPSANNPLCAPVWTRLRCMQAPDSDIAFALLAYLSDMTVLNASLSPHGRNFFARDITMASLDHAIWFHRIPDWSDWVLLVHHAAGNEAGMGLGGLRIFNRDGSLVASIMQQGFIKPKLPDF